MYLEYRCQEDGDSCKDEHHQACQPLLPVGRGEELAMVWGSPWGAQAGDPTQTPL